jgi:hypothetical protein
VWNASGAQVAVGRVARIVGPGCRGRAGKRACGCRESMGLLSSTAQDVGEGTVRRSGVNGGRGRRRVGTEVWAPPDASRPASVAAGFR